jgi:hypothetical protein
LDRHPAKAGIQGTGVRLALIVPFAATTTVSSGAMPTTAGGMRYAAAATGMRPTGTGGWTTATGTRRRTRAMRPAAAPKHRPGRTTRDGDVRGSDRRGG